MALARKIQFVVGAAILLFDTSRSPAQQISITGGNLVMAVTTGAAGSEPVAVTNTNDRLRYKRLSVISKITVSTSCPGQNFNLSVIAVSPTDGTAMPAVTLVNGQPESDFIVNIPKSPPSNNRTATLRYTAWATFAQGNSAEVGNDVHKVTYTIVAQ
jgi:hypothetical protein